MELIKKAVKRTSTTNAQNSNNTTLKPKIKTRIQRILYELENACKEIPSSSFPFEVFYTDDDIKLMEGYL